MHSVVLTVLAPGYSFWVAHILKMYSTCCTEWAELHEATPTFLSLMMKACSKGLKNVRHNCTMPVRPGPMDCVFCMLILVRRILHSF